MPIIKNFLEALQAERRWIFGEAERRDNDRWPQGLLLEPLWTPWSF